MRKLSRGMQQQGMSLMLNPIRSLMHRREWEQPTDINFLHKVQQLHSQDLQCTRRRQVHPWPIHRLEQQGPRLQASLSIHKSQALSCQKSGTCKV